mgnify:CR=1 FL=1
MVRVIKISVSLYPVHLQIINSISNQRGGGVSRALQYLLEDWQRLKSAPHDDLPLHPETAKTKSSLLNSI